MSDAPERRAIFHEELTGCAQGFIRQMLDTVPEAESVAVVFSYAVPSDNLPFAVIMGQSGSAKTPAEIVHMAQQLWRTLDAQLQAAAQTIRNIDHHMAEQARTLKHLQDNIHAAHGELATLSAGSSDQDTGGGSTIEGAAQSGRPADR